MHNTTNPTPTGYRVTRELGTVRGIIVRSRYDATEIGAGGSEVLCSGTAFVVESAG
jgi:uncharacterized protein YbjQ (UPF0145 family)